MPRINHVALKLRSPDGTIAEIVDPGQYEKFEVV